MKNVIELINKRIEIGKKYSMEFYKSLNIATSPEIKTLLRNMMELQDTDILFLSRLKSEIEDEMKIS